MAHLPGGAEGTLKFNEIEHVTLKKKYLWIILPGFEGSPYYNGPCLFSAHPPASYLFFFFKPGMRKIKYLHSQSWEISGWLF